MRITAAVTATEGAPFLLQDVELGELRDDEVLVGPSAIMAAAIAGAAAIVAVDVNPAMTHTYDLDRIEEAARDAETGRVVKPVLRMT